MHRPWNSSPLRLYRPQPCLTFAPLAWLKLQYFCHAGPTEIGGFGITAEDDPLYVEEFITVRQHVSPVTVHFHDDSVADFFDRCVDRGLPPDRFARLWCHTHPGASVVPSVTDEETFARSFGRCDWAVMFILGRTGKTYARLAFTAGPGAQLELAAAVDWSKWPACLVDQRSPQGAEAEHWQQEYVANIHHLPEPTDPFAGMPLRDDDPWRQFGWSPELDLLTFEPVEETRTHEPDPKPRAS